MIHCRKSVPTPYTKAPNTRPEDGVAYSIKTFRTCIIVPALNIGMARCYDWQSIYATSGHVYTHAIHWCLNSEVEYLKSIYFEGIHNIWICFHRTLLTSYVGGYRDTYFVSVKTAHMIVIWQNNLLGFILIYMHVNYISIISFCHHADIKIIDLSRTNIDQYRSALCDIYIDWTNKLNDAKQDIYQCYWWIQR